MKIYKIINKINKKAYIGQTIRTIDIRFIEHKSEKRYSNSALLNAIKKYGKENFTIEVMDTANSIEELNVKEEFYINKCNTLVPNGYNLKMGGNNKTYSLQSRNKMSKSASLRIRNPHSIDTRNKMSSSHKGKIKSISHRANISKAKKKLVKCNETGVIYDSLTSAGKALDVTKGSIWRVLTGKMKTVKGLTFCYVGKHESL